METRPKIKIELTATEKVLELAGWILIAAVWLLTITNYNDLPEIIPVHYNGAGQADGFGEKSTIWTLPLIATILFVGMTVLNKFPHIFNYPVKITKENALSQYIGATRLMRYLKLIIVALLGFITFKTIQSTHEQAEGVGIYLLPLTIALTIIPLIYFVAKSFKTQE